MKICIFGAGAIGGYLAAKLAGGNDQISCIARGEHLAAIRRDGLTLIEGDSRRSVDIECTDDAEQLGPQDAVFVTLKSHAVPGAVDAIAALFGPDTMVVSAQNGVPWWYFYGQGDADPPQLRSVDPGGVLWSRLGPERAIGSVVYPAARIIEPGVVQHVFGNRFTIGEPDASDSPRIRALSKRLIAVGLQAPVASSIRTEIWTKLVANASYNPVSLLTGRTLGALLNDEATCRLLRLAMEEATAVAAALGIALEHSPDDLIEATRPVGEHKTSMLQDFEAGRPIELDPIVGAVRELGQLCAAPTPTLDILFELAAQKAKLAGCYPAD